MRLPTTTASVLAIVGIVVGLSSCAAPYRIDYVEESLRQATQADVIQKLGYPQRLKRTKNGDQVWEYDFQGKERQCVTYLVTLTPEDEVRQWERRECPQEGRSSRRSPQ